MMNFRFGIRLKLILLSSFLFTIPWLGYQYVWELENYLRLGQEQTMVGTARAVATALHERPKLFDNHASYLSDVKPGTDLYAHNIVDPIRLDGRLSDWQDYSHRSLLYEHGNLLDAREDYQAESFSFKHMVGKYGRYLYAYFEVTDESLVFRDRNNLGVHRNDHLQISMLDPEEKFRRYVVSAKQEGWFDTYLMEDDQAKKRPVRPENRIQGQWNSTSVGYNIELRIPLSMLSSKIAFALVDVDDSESKIQKYRVGTANTSESESLGTVLVPSPDIEKIIKGLKYAHSRVWVVDKHRRVLARSGDIQQSSGLGLNAVQNQSSSWWQYIEQNWLLPVYYKILTRPPAEFIDELQDAYALKGRDLTSALSGEESSLWHLSPDAKAVILSAAHPIWIEDKVMGAVVVEQTTNGIRSLRNKALEKLFHIILAVMSVGTLALFLFASRISSRIRNLRNDTESAIDANGKILSNIQPSATQDEIGDLSRTFHGVLTKLGHYNQYLENMASRLSHELRTPVAIVSSSLDNLVMENKDSGSEPYIRRAQEGIQRLSKILSNMSEATRLEQSLQSTEREQFPVSQLLSGCLEGYKLAYPGYRFVSHIDDSPNTLFGSPELFSQMLDKIVANAVEFSEAHSDIEFALNTHQNVLNLTVKNKGELLPERMQLELLDSMVSIRKQQHTEEPHLGLGLYIAKIIAEYHKGKISIANTSVKDGVEVAMVFEL